MNGPSTGTCSPRLLVEAPERQIRAVHDLHLRPEAGVDARELHRDLAVHVAARVLRRDLGGPDLEHEVLQRGRRVDRLVHDRLLLAGQVAEDEFAFDFDLLTL